MDQQLLFACDLKGLILFVDSGGTITLNQRHTHTHFGCQFKKDSVENRAVRSFVYRHFQKANLAILTLIFSGQYLLTLSARECGRKR